MKKITNYFDLPAKKKEFLKTHARTHAEKREISSWSLVSRRESDTIYSVGRYYFFFFLCGGKKLSEFKSFRETKREREREREIEKHTVPHNSPHRTDPHTHTQREFFYFSHTKGTTSKKKDYTYIS